MSVTELSDKVGITMATIGVLICWDQWYPEAARLMALAGAELLLYPTAIGWDPSDEQAEKDRQRNAWILSHRGHAVANGLPVLSCNRPSVGIRLDTVGVPMMKPLASTAMLEAPGPPCLRRRPRRPASSPTPGCR